MARRLFIPIGLFLAIVFAVPVVAAQEAKKGAATKPDRIDGTVHMIDTGAKMITVRLRGKTEQRQALYDDKTAFTFRNKPAKLDDVKEGRRVIIVGKNNEKHQLVATRVDVRDEK